MPPNVGIRSDCLFWLHTHDVSGTIHVEAPREMEFTLGQFFQIWGQPLSSTELLVHRTDAAHQIRAFVNGQEYQGDPATIPLREHAVITLEYGPPFPPPHTYQFRPGE